MTTITFSISLTSKILLSVDASDVGGERGSIGEGLGARTGGGMYTLGHRGRWGGPGGMGRQVPGDGREIREPGGGQGGRGRQ